MSYKRILIVDDDPDVRRGMQVRLSANNYETFTAADALSGIVVKPDLIILDIGLPAGGLDILFPRCKLP